MCVLKSINLNVENHNVSTSNILLETLGNYIPITVTLRAPIKNIRIENKDSVSTTPCDNHVPLERELNAYKSFLIELLFLIKKLIQEIKDSNNETANLTYIAMLIEQTVSVNEKNEVKNSIIQSLTKQYNIVLIVLQLITVILIMIIIIVILLIIMIIIKIMITIIYVKVLTIS